MNTLQTHIDHYLTYCRYQKRLDEKTLKAYRIDLTQFLSQISCSAPEEINSTIIEDFIVILRFLKSALSLFRISGADRTQSIS